MEFDELAIQRASVRSYSKKAIPVEDIRYMIKIASTAPSINNSQPWKFIAVTNKELMNKLAGAVSNKINLMFPDKGSLPEKNNVKPVVEQFSTFFADAPLVIAVTSEPYKAVIDDMLNHYRYDHSDINQIRNYPNYQTIGAAIQNLILAAGNKGYGACWLTGPMVAKEELERLLDIEKPFSLTALVSVGVPLEKPVPRDKKPLGDILEILS